jgi:hypothetical protein
VFWISLLLPCSQLQSLNSHAFWLCLRNVIVIMGLHKHYHLLDVIHVKNIEMYKPAGRSLDATLLVEHYFVEENNYVGALIS